MSKLNNVMVRSGILIIFRFLYIMKEGSNCIQIKIYGVWVILASLVDLFEYVDPLAGSYSKYDLLLVYTSKII